MQSADKNTKSPFLITILSAIIFLFLIIPYLPIFSSDNIAPESKKPAPRGMVFIPGGYAVIGSGSDDPEAFPGEKPAKKVFIKDFYIDKYEITNEEYGKCVKAGGCSYFPNILNPMFKDSLGPKQPAVPLSWERAFEYCRWAGKRLPTEAEWEKTARGGAMGTAYPWGNDAPSCARANYRGCNESTVAAGSYPPGHYGVHDMAGNGYEWVNDWATACREGCGAESCGDNCAGDNPQGPCSGKYPCENRDKKILKGGSWWWPATHMRGSWRRTERINSGGHRLSARCASDTIHLTNSPAWMIKTPPPKLKDPEYPSEKELEIFHNIDADVINKTICEKRWTSPAHCKDPESYIVTNERLTYMFAPYVKNIGGGYAGVAADANYTFIAHARSRWVWLFDFDRNIVSLHKILKALILKSITPEIFVERFHREKEKSTYEIIRAAYGANRDFELIKYVYFKYYPQLYEAYYQSLKPNRDYGDFGWLRNRDAYNYIRLLYSQNRIAIIPGDMLKDKTMRSIAKAAKKLEVPIRLYYPSNAEEFWVFSANYKENIASMPFDEASIVIRTVHEYPWHRYMDGDRFWHYVVHGALNYQKKIGLKDYFIIDHFRQERVFPKRGYDIFSTIQVPSSLPEDVLKTYQVK